MAPVKPSATARCTCYPEALSLSQALCLSQKRFCLSINIGMAGLDVDAQGGYFTFT